MTNTDAPTPLERASRARSADALARARRAIVALEHRGERVNFNTVASEARVSKGYLYRQPDLRNMITDRRPRPPSTITPSPRAVMDRESAAQHKLAIATAALKRLRAENQQLRKEVAQLRGDLAHERDKNRF